MEMYVVGVYKQDKTIQGFRILAINNDGTTEVRDESYKNVYGVLKSHRAVIKNLKIENNSIKGINGSLDRYGIVNKSQSLVILKELQDKYGKTQGYFCSDTLGKTKNLTEDQVIYFADKLAIANGKIVPGTDGKRHISSIEGTYDIRKIQQNNQQKTQKQNNKTNENNQSTLPKDVVDLINNIKSRKEYIGSFSEKIIATIEKSGRCSDRQKKALQTQLNDWNNPSNNANSMIDDAIKIIDELRTYEEYDNDFIRKIAASVLRYKKCSIKQFNLLKEALDTYHKTGHKKQDKGLSTSNTQQNSNITPASQPSTPASQPSTPASQPSTPASQPSTPASQPSTPQSNKYQKIKSKIERDNRAEERKAEEDAKKEAVAQARKALNNKSKRALTQNIKSDGLLDYSLTKDNRAYVEGFTEGAEIQKELIIPETVTIDNKTYKITGIGIEAFASEKIESVITSKNINDIGQGAFSNCEQLVSADFSKSNHTMLPARIFKNCISLERVLVGSYIQRVHEYAFYYCKSLSKIELPSECSTIARSAFEYCTNLNSCENNVKNIDYGAFEKCIKLSEFNFRNINIIGPQAFRKTGFKQLKLPGNITSIGEKAFADCYLLQKVNIEEGVKELGNFCFAKSEFESVPEGNPDNIDKIKLEEIYAPKSLSLIGIDAFRNTGLVIGWTGSVAESKCIAYLTPFKRLDAVNLDNSTTTRVKASLIGVNSTNLLKKALDVSEDNASNPDFKMRTDKLIDIPFNDNQLAFLHVNKATEEKEPHIKFKATVNYLQDITNMIKSPLDNGVLRLQDTYYVLNSTIYDDDCNKIMKITYQIMDTLESGSFIAVFMNNHLKYMVDCNLFTDINMMNTMPISDTLPVEQFLHCGDIIGETSTISGNSGILEDELGNKENIGLSLYKRLYDNAIIINTSKRDELMYIPAVDKVLNLHDKRGDNIEGEDKVESECKSIVDITDYKGLLKEINKIKKNIGGSEKFFKDLESLSSREVNARIKNINTIEDEKEAQLFRVSKQFNSIVDSAGVAPNPNMLTYELFNELSKSYWMISKDEDWLQSTGKKSLNRTAEYHIGKYKLTEYKSNQIVKFSNPYMNGCKGAYIFTLTSNNTILGVYASRYNMHTITEKLYDLTNIKQDVTIPDSIFTSPENIDKLDSNLFYNFYDVLYSKNGWQFSSFNKYSSGIYHAQFNISMYKPNGIFYLTMSRLTTVRKDSEKSYVAFKTMPILPIGNMDRALMVATTTNTNAKDSKLYNELLALAAYCDRQDRLLRVYEQDKINEIENAYNRYVEARKLAMSGVKNVQQYKNLISDRAVYMLGTVHQGTLQREKMESNYDEEYSFDAIDVYSENTDDLLEDEDLDIEITDEDLRDFGIEEDNNETNNETDNDMSFESFANLAKSMGITDESQINAMYVSFINNN